MPQWETIVAGIIIAGLCLGVPVWSQEIDLTQYNILENSSFEQGKDTPRGWGTKVREGKQRVEFEWSKTESHTGERSVSVQGDPGKRKLGGLD